MSPISKTLQHVLGWSGGENQAIRLLESIASCGSINRAAKEVGLSYKGAWEKIENLNNLSDEPLVTRQVGGSGGGGTVLTDEGRELLQKVAVLRREFAAFVGFFGERPEDALNALKMLRRFEMKVSARNVWAGAVAKIEKGAVNSVVTIALKGGDTVVAVITDNSVIRLGLEPGTEVLAMVKAPSVMLGRDIKRESLSARNILMGRVARIVPGVVNDEVIIDLPGGSTVTAINTSESVRRMDLAPGIEVAAIFKASSVLLAVV
ncbi:MAG: TOBE domain-containing protein [Pseudomonadota bacterium]